VKTHITRRSFLSRFGFAAAGAAAFVLWPRVSSAFPVRRRRGVPARPRLASRVGGRCASSSLYGPDPSARR
jgi:hypothetical protein